MNEIYTDVSIKCSKLTVLYVNNTYYNNVL